MHWTERPALHRRVLQDPQTCPPGPSGFQVEILLPHMMVLELEPYGGHEWGALMSATAPTRKRPPGDDAGPLTLGSSFQNGSSEVLLAVSRCEASVAAS